MKLVSTAALGAVLVLAATAQTAPPAATMSNAAARKTPLQIRLAPENGSGESGTATLYDGAKGLIVKVRTAGDVDVDQPAHIHKGTCAKLDPKPAYPLKTLHEGQSETTIPDVTIAQLQKAPFAINIHKSTKEIPVYVSCGNIVAAK